MKRFLTSLTLLVAGLMLLVVTGCNASAQVASTIPVTLTASPSALPPYAVGQTITETLTATNTNPATIAAGNITEPVTINASPKNVPATANMNLIWYPTNGISYDVPAVVAQCTVPPGVTLSNLSTGITQSTANSVSTVQWTIGTLPGKASVTGSFTVTFLVAVP